MIPSNVNAAPGEWGLTVADGQLVFKRPDGQSFSPGKVEQFTASELVLSPDPPRCLTGLFTYGSRERGRVYCGPQQYRQKGVPGWAFGR